MASYDVASSICRPLEEEVKEEKEGPTGQPTKGEAAAPATLGAAATAAADVDDATANVDNARAATTITEPALALTGFVPHDATDSAEGGNDDTPAAIPPAKAPREANSKGKAAANEEEVDPTEAWNTAQVQQLHSAQAKTNPGRPVQVDSMKTRAESAYGFSA